MWDLGLRKGLLGVLDSESHMDQVGGVELEGMKGGGCVAGIRVTYGEGSGVELEGTNGGGCGVGLGTTYEEVWALALGVTNGGGWGA